MMKQRPSGAGGRPSRFCKFLLLAAGFKVCLLGLVLAEPFISVPLLRISAESLMASWHALSVFTVPSLVAPGQAPGTEEPAAGLTAGDLRERPSFHAAAFAAAPPSAAPATSGPQDKPQAGASNLDIMTRRQEELNRREQDLHALEKELDTRLEQMQGLETRLQTMLKDAEDTKNEKYKHLVDVLSNMKSRQAAEVLQTLDEKIAVKVLAGMRGRQAGEILTYAEPVKAARLTEALARMQMPLE